MKGLVMLRIVSPENRKLFSQNLDDYLRLWKKILIDQLGWDLKSNNGKETDQFDHDQAHYLIYKLPKTGKVAGGVRLTPATAPNLTLDIFSNLIDPQKSFSPVPDVWECSRFVIDSMKTETQRGLIKEATLMLFIGMVEYGLLHGVRSYIATTEVRLERVLRMAQWHFERLGSVEKIGNTYAVSGLLEVSKSINRRIRENARILNPIFWNETTVKQSFSSYKLCH
jgi:acyl homoserine lactone synthase